MPGISKATYICIRCSKVFTDRKGSYYRNGISFCVDHHPNKQPAKTEEKK